MYAGALNERLEQLEQKIDRVLLLLEGNGVPERGLLIRVDRIEQREAARQWTLRAVLVAILGLITERVTRHL